MFKSPYDTTLLSAFNITPTLRAIERAYVTAKEQFTLPIKGDDENRNIGSDILTLVPGHAEVPLFAHPISFTTVHKTTVTVADVRSFTRLTRDNQVVISSPLDYQFTVLRAVLSHRWLDDLNYRDLANLGVIPMRIFSQWLTNVITTRLGLNPDIQIRVAVIAAYYYQCLFIKDDKGVIDEREKQKIALLIARATFADVKNVFDIIDNVGTITNVTELVHALVTHSNSMRFENFNLEFLYTVLNGSWFGANSKEVLAAALEHPPTWIALSWVCLTERGYKNTKIGQILYNVKSDEIDAFVKNVMGLVKLS